VTIDLTATAKNAISDFVDTQNDAFIDYILVAGTPAPSNTWISNCTYTSRNTYNPTTGAGRFYLKPKAAIGGGGNSTASYDNECTPFLDESTLKVIDFTRSRMTSLGRRAFYNCTGLTEVRFGYQMAELGTECFYQCTSLATLVGLSYLLTIGASCFRKCTSLTSINTNNIITMGVSAFRDCTGLTSVTLNVNLVDCGGYAFSGCTALTSLTITGGGSLATIPNYMFNSCSALTSVSIPEPIAHIGRHAFYGCTQLATLTLPHTLVDVGYEAFRSTKAQLVVTCNAQIPPYCANLAFGVDASGMTKPTSGSRVLKVPTNSLPYYKALNSTYGVVSGWALQFKDSNIQAIS
jgi:hypothetical protein